MVLQEGNGGMDKKVSEKPLSKLVRMDSVKSRPSRQMS